MKHTRKTATATLSVLLALLPLANPMAAQDGEGGSSQEIQRIVTEAQRVATEWSNRLREWKDADKTPTTYVGVVIERVPDVLRDYIDLPEGVGLLLSHISKDSPAEKAGLVDNDIIVSFDGQLVINYNQLSTLIDLKGPGAEVPVKILRKGEEMEFILIPEERVRRNGRFVAPDAPEVPEIPEIPDPEEVGALMQRIDEWIPGSVKVFIDENEQVHVDLQDLKENLQDLKAKIARINDLGSGESELVREYGDLGARTTIVHVEDRNVNYKTTEGRLALTSSESGQKAMVWDNQGKLIYQGDLPENYESQLPGKAVEIIQSFYDSQEKLQMDANGRDLEIQFNDEAGDPVTFIQD